jgi:hypothetical protein
MDDGIPFENVDDQQPVGLFISDQHLGGPLALA